MTYEQIKATYDIWKTNRDAYPWYELYRATANWIGESPSTLKFGAKKEVWSFLLAAANVNENKPNDAMAALGQIYSRNQVDLRWGDESAESIREKVQQASNNIALAVIGSIIEAYEGSGSLSSLSIDTIAKRDASSAAEIAFRGLKEPWAGAPFFVLWGHTSSLKEFVIDKDGTYDTLAMLDSVKAALLENDSSIASALWNNAYRILDQSFRNATFSDVIGAGVEAWSLVFDDLRQEYGAHYSSINPLSSLFQIGKMAADVGNRALVISSEKSVIAHSGDGDDELYFVNPSQGSIVNGGLRHEATTTMRGHRRAPDRSGAAQKDGRRGGGGVMMLFRTNAKKGGNAACRLSHFAEKIAAVGCDNASDYPISACKQSDLPWNGGEDVARVTIARHNIVGRRVRMAFEPQALQFFFCSRHAAAGRVPDAHIVFPVYSGSIHGRPKQPAGTLQWNPNKFDQKERR